MPIILNNLTAGKPLALDPLRLVQERLLIQGASGSGKSYLLRSILEQALALSLPIVVIDHEGEFSTLAEVYPVAVVPADELPTTESRYALAESSARHRSSYVLDLSELDPTHRAPIVGDLVQYSLDLPREYWHNRIIAIDEVHEFAPQIGKPESKQPLSLLAAKGRKRGLCLIAATQRISKFDKNTAAELRNVLIGQTTFDPDVRRALETLAQDQGANERRKLKALYHKFLGFGPSISTSEPVRISAQTPKTNPPESGIKTAKHTPTLITASHYLRRSGILLTTTPEHILTHTTTRLTWSDYLAACLAIDHWARPDLSAKSRRSLLVAAFGILDDAQQVLPPSPIAHQVETFAIGWGSAGANLPLSVEYLQAEDSSPLPIDSILVASPIYQCLTRVLQRAQQTSPKQ